VLFNFDEDIDLDTNETYYIGVTQTILGSTGYSWYYYNSSGLNDSYLYGHSWIKKTDKLESHPEFDWAFQTSSWTDDDINISIQYSSVFPGPWSTLASNEENDGLFIWNTEGYPDSEGYRIRVLAEDQIGNLNSDESDGLFTIDNEGVSVYGVSITDVTLDSTEFTTDGDRVEITATVLGEISNVTADLTGFGGGSEVEPNSFFNDIATWIVYSVDCDPSDGEITVDVIAYDPSGDFSTSSASIIADNTGPTLEILRPLPGIYIMDSMRILPYPYPVIFGQMTILAEVNDAGTGVDTVEVYIDDVLKGDSSEAPYDWTWDEASIGFFKIELKAYDNIGLNATESINDVFILNLDIWD
jgi:hypothetical protein